MIQKFWKVIRYKLWKGERLSPLETVVLYETVSPEEAELVREWRKQNFLKDIARREAEEAAFGNGERDWVLARFKHSLERSSKLHQVYIWMRQGLNSEMISREMGISITKVEEAEKKIIVCYQTLTRNKTASLESSSAKTLLMLLSAQYRTFIRKDRTGTVEYLFYRKNDLLGSATAYVVLPDWPVVIRRADGMVLNSCFDADTTVVPGTFRKVTDADDPSRVVARLTWSGYGEHELWLPSGKKVRIHSDKETHKFYAGDTLIAEYRLLPQKQSTVLSFELNSCLKLYADLDDTTAMMLLLFPIIRFGL